MNTPHLSPQIDGQSAAGPVKLVTSNTPIVEVADLHKRFGDLTVLDGVNATVDVGRITAIIGPNAAGKSTLIKSILGLVRPDVGRIVVNGMTVNADPDYRRSIGYMPQLAKFPENLTGREVLAMLEHLRGPSVERDEELIETLGLEPELDKQTRTLSGGTLQKLNAAIAFLFRPPLLILDEPTAGLDPVASGIVKDKVVRATHAGASVILTSHVMSELEELSDVIVFLLDGRIQFRGTQEELRRLTGQLRLEQAVASLMTNPAS